MRILLVKTSSLGDVIHNLPVATDIARAMPGAQVDWCVEESFAAIPALHPAVSRVIPVALRRWRRRLLGTTTLAEMKGFQRLLRDTRYDAVLDTQGLLKSALLARLAHGERLGFAADSAREPIAARFYGRRFSVDRKQHAVLRNRRLAAQALGYTIDPDAIDYGLDVRPLAADWLPPDPYVVCLTATSRADKLWPPDHWIALLAELHRRGIAAVLPAGSPGERQRADEIAATCAAARVAPALDLAALAGLLRGATTTIGVDTGLSHLSVAVGTPTIALYTATDPALTGAVGSAYWRNLGGRGLVPSVADVLVALAAAPKV